MCVCFVVVCIYCVLIVVIMGRCSEFSACIVCQVVRLYSVVEIVVMFILSYFKLDSGW